MSDPVHQDIDRTRLDVEIKQLKLEKDQYVATDKVYAASLEAAITEREKMLVERDKIDFERKRTTYALLSAVFAVVGIVATYLSTFYTQQKQHETAIEAQNIQMDVQNSLAMAKINHEIMVELSGNSDKNAISQKLNLYVSTYILDYDVYLKIRRDLGLPGDPIAKPPPRKSH